MAGLVGATATTVTSHGTSDAWAAEVVSPTVQVLTGVSAVAADDVWAVGAEGRNYDHTVIEHWDGSQWTRVASPNPGVGFDSLRSVAALTPSDAWAVGSYDATGDPYAYRSMILHWDGAEWSQVASPNPGKHAFLLDVTAVSADDIWAVGYSAKNNQLAPASTFLAHWDGERWRQSPSPNLGDGYSSQLRSVSAASANDVWAVGSAYKGDNERIILLHWDGKAWTFVEGAQQGSSMTCVGGIAAPSNSQAWVVGGTVASKSVIDTWDGDQWSRQSSGPRGRLSSVSAYSTEDAWAVGYSGSYCGYPDSKGLALHWDGGAWAEVAIDRPGHSTSYALRDVADRTPTDVWAVGESQRRSRNRTPLIEHWDGVSWTTVRPAA